MKSRTRSRKPASIGSNHSSRRPTAISASEPRTGNFVLLLVMAWSPPAHNAGIVWVSAPGDYATFNSNHTPDGTGYSSAGCSPAEPASASPVTDIVVQSRSSAAIKRAAQLPCRDAVQVAPPRARRERECHLYFARRVTFLSCADIAEPFIPARREP